MSSLPTTSILEHPAALLPRLTDRVDDLRTDAARRIGEGRKAQFGQYFTPPSVAWFLAGMLEAPSTDVHILDPGAGVGSLFAACVDELCHREQPPKRITVTAFEIDEFLIEYLQDSIRLCKAECERAGVAFEGKVVRGDFIGHAVDFLGGNLFSETSLLQQHPFNVAVINPPYKKINVESEARRQLRRIGMETSNLYSGFLAAALLLLEPGGEMAAITPRSFCNGLYFRPFREFLFRSASLSKIHLFEARDKAFREDAVLQENIIFSLVKDPRQRGRVTITSSHSPTDDLVRIREAEHGQILNPADSQSFIHITPDLAGQRASEGMARFTSTLRDLGLSVSTGRVIDFRNRERLKSDPEEGTVPLIYPAHFERGFVQWPKQGGKKPNAIRVTPETAFWLVPNGDYVLTKRFTTKEEKKRVVAVLWEQKEFPGEWVGFENHLNYFHCDGKGMDPSLAKGLAAFLNWSLVDAHFRQFNGHTQVNATDLRSLRYPTRERLIDLGEKLSRERLDQEELDAFLEGELFEMSDDSRDETPTPVQQRTQEALDVLKALGLPRGQLNERSALTLLALLGLRPEMSWSEAVPSMMGITPIMEFIATHYGKTYAPNTRETVRRFTVHQFIEAGLILPNPDSPARPINSPKTVYQVEESALQLLRSYGSPEWDVHLAAYLATVETLKQRYAREREMTRIPIRIAPGKEITLSPGGQNILVEKIITEFAERFTPGATLLYVGDTGEKFAHFDEEGLHRLGVTVDEHGKMPDVIVHYPQKNWLILIEAVTSHGPVNAKRHEELERLFQKSTAGLVYVTAFLSRQAMKEYFHDISWETEVWIAEEPTHMIHFNGERFLGPFG